MNTLKKILGWVLGIVGALALLDVYLYYSNYIKQCTSYTGGIELLFPAVGERAVQICNQQLMNSDSMFILLFMVVVGVLGIYSWYLLAINKNKEVNN